MGNFHDIQERIHSIILLVFKNALYMQTVI